MFYKILLVIYLVCLFVEFVLLCMNLYRLIKDKRNQDELDRIMVEMLEREEETEDEEE